MIDELQRSYQGQPEAFLVETRLVLFSKGDVVALKHNWRRHLELFFLAILREDLHGSSDRFLESTLQLNWLEPSKEDPLVYVVGNEDDKTPPQCILYIASVDLHSERYLLSKSKEQLIKYLGNGSNETDSEGAGDDNREEEDDQPTRFEAGCSRSGRGVTRYMM